MIGKYRVEKLL